MDVLFQKLSEEKLKEVEEWPIDCECLVFKRNKINHGQNIMEDSLYEEIFLRLQLRKNYVLQLKPDEK